MAGSQQSTDNKVAARSSTVVLVLAQKTGAEQGASLAPAPATRVFQHLAMEHHHLAWCPVPATEPASPSQLIPGSYSIGSFPEPSFSINRKASSTHQSAASPGNLLGQRASDQTLLHEELSPTPYRAEF